MNKKYMEYRRTREPLLARRLLLDKVRAGQEKAALEEAAALLAMLAFVYMVFRYVRLRCAKEPRRPQYLTSVVGCVG